MRKDYTDMAKQAIQLATREAKALNHAYVGTEHLLLGLLEVEDSVASVVLRNARIEPEKVRSMIRKFVNPGEVALAGKGTFSPKAEKIMRDAMEMADQFHRSKVGTEHLMLAMLRDVDCVASKLISTLVSNTWPIFSGVIQAMGENPEDYKDVFRRKDASEEESSGTPTLNQYGRDLTKLAAEGKLDPVIGREEELARVIQILSRRTKNNPCLVGEPGVGKTAIVEALAQRIAAGQVPATVRDKRVILLDLSAMVAGSKYRGEFEERIKNVINEVAQNRQIVLFIDEIHTIIGAGGAEGSMDASNILKPALARGEIQVVGATTMAEFRKYFERDAALERRFQPIDVSEPDREASIQVLKGIRHKYEEHHGLTITDAAVEAAVDLSMRYVNDRFLPDKAIDLMDEAASMVRMEGMQEKPRERRWREEWNTLRQEKELALIDGRHEDAIEISSQQRKLEKKLEKLQHDADDEGLQVTQEEIARVVSRWIKIPVAQLEEKEHERLLRLEKTLHKRVIGQDEAVVALAKAVRRSRVGLKAQGRPIGSFLFLGPTGVGKTELSKALAEALFGDENALIRIDMSEYMEKHSVSKMIGSPPGYVGFEDGGQLSDKVRRNPYSVVLFDEIEKAHPDVFNILLQILDDGHVTDSKGRKIDFKNTVIIMTSNAGATSIVEPKRLGFVTEANAESDYKKMKSDVMEEVRRIFRPEFLNRIDEVIVFKMLEKEDLKKIVTLLLKDLIQRCQEQLGFTLKVRDSAKQQLVAWGSDHKYGARPLRRTIQSKVEDELAELVLNGKIKAGDTVTIGRKKDELSFSIDGASQK